MHFMNPVPMMKLVEVIRGQDTSDATTDHASSRRRGARQGPGRGNDYPGFISNRVLMPMINEAVFCLMEGVATREGIDEIMKLGMNHPMGPLTPWPTSSASMSASTSSTCCNDGLGDDKYRACPLLRRMVAAGHLGRRPARASTTTSERNPAAPHPETRHDRRPGLRTERATAADGRVRSHEAGGVPPDKELDPAPSSHRTPRVGPRAASSRARRSRRPRRGAPGDHDAAGVRRQPISATSRAA
jgi:3-hydroxyacyl-CoA dehydrogenase